MGKRSAFPRRRADAYLTIDPKAVKALLIKCFRYVTHRSLETQLSAIRRDDAA